MIINFITNNLLKFKEVQKNIYPIKLRQINVDLEEIQETNPKKIIYFKIKNAIKFSKGPFIIEDNSFTMEALGGKLPGPLIKWFLKSLGTKKLYKLAGRGKKIACAHSFFAYVNNAKIQKIFSAKTNGKIVSPRGSYKFGFDEIFQPTGFSSTMSEMKAGGDFSQSPRNKAVKKLKKYLLLLKEV